MQYLIYSTSRNKTRPVWRPRQVGSV